MANFLKNHLHPLGSRIIYWNIILLVLIKVVLPYSVFQHANILDNIVLFDSREVITDTNEVRSQNGLPPLKPNVLLDNAAAEKLNDMLTNGYFAHTSPTGITPWYWIKDVHYNYSIAGENLAVGFFSASDTVQAWMNSPSHKANLLNTQYQDIGIAVGKGTVNGMQGIVVVQMFGKEALAVVQPKPAPPPQPIVTPQPSLTPQTVALVESEFEVAPQPVSTDKDIPVTAPVIVNGQKSEQVNQLLGTANIVYAIYSFAFALLSIFAFFIFGRHHHLAIKSAIHATIFVLAVTVTSVGVHFGAVIF